MMMPWHFRPGIWWVELIGVILMLLFWAGLITLIILAVRAIFRSTGPANTGEFSSRPGGPNALDILKQRYARGEINRDEYMAMKKDLET
jgi:putative membrane protein